MTTPGLTPATTPNKSKNFFGIIGLITALLCGTQLLGLIFGILGVRAAKNGQATNRGMSLFAVVWGSIWLALTAGAGAWTAANWDDGRVVIAWAGPAGADAANVDRAIHEFQAENDGYIIANIVFDGENYYVGDAVIKAESSNPTILYFIDGEGGHCLKIDNGSSSANISHGNVACEGTPQEVQSPQAG